MSIIYFNFNIDHINSRIYYQMYTIIKPDITNNGYILLCVCVFILS